MFEGFFERIQGFGTESNKRVPALFALFDILGPESLDKDFYRVRFRWARLTQDCAQACKE